MKKKKIKKKKKILLAFLDPLEWSTENNFFFKGGLIWDTIDGFLVCHT